MTNQIQKKDFISFAYFKLQEIIIFFIYISQVDMRKPSQEIEMNRILIGVTGGSAAGKTTLCNNILKQMSFDSSFKVQIIPLDAFYKNIDKTKINVADYNFDHPNSLDFDDAYKVLIDLLNGRPTKIPKYSFVTHQRLSEVQYVKPTDVIIFQGILAFYDQRIRNLMKYKIFMHCDDDIRLCRRLKRDVQERGRTIQNVLFQYNRFVKQAYSDFIYPTIRYADLIVPGSRPNKVSVDFIVQHLKNITKQISFYKRAITTLIYFYGDILENFLNENDVIEPDYYLNEDTKQTEFFFPSTSQHKKQLDLFIQQIINQTFTILYYKEIFIHQFLRILYSFINKIINLRNYEISDIEIVKFYDANSLEEIEMDNEKKVKIIFIPNITSSNYESIINFRKKLPLSYSIIVLNIFCYHTKIRKLNTLQFTTFVNLYCIANEKRFQEVLFANKKEDEIYFDLFENIDLLNYSWEKLREQVNKCEEVQ